MEVKIRRSEVQDYLLLHSKRESELQVLILKYITFILWFQDVKSRAFYILGKSCTIGLTPHPWK